MKQYFTLAVELARAAVLITLTVTDALRGNPSLIPDAFDARAASAKAIHNLGDAASARPRPTRSTGNNFTTRSRGRADRSKTP
ncbi:hypothetical protein [Bifidobacterium olomucense]|uniref:hypothetical protein n=1 Tax=Bifidobacterium olomucense TaxID=2675324 RepID=UPI00145D4ED7|nr:hypothetical protein [Bifidobacterium sp. DSM 109959]